ncbi:MAG: VanZ family protein [Colwellia sp.]|nr:VanZ family protein [Colwellia sp.]
MKNRHHFLFLLIILLSLLGLVFSNDIRILLFEHTKIDSIGHFVGFFCLSLLLNSIFKFPLLTTVICLVFYAALSEIGQYYLGFRNGEFRDFVADVVGILFFALLKWIYTVYWRKSSL